MLQLVKNFRLNYVLTAVKCQYNMIDTIVHVKYLKMFD